MGMAGSLTNMFCEVLFHFVDTVNIRAKAKTSTISTTNMFKAIVAKEGVYGLSKGISACFYGSIICGFIYFSLYKIIKTYLHDRYNTTLPAPVIFFFGSFIAELFTLMVYYPYDMIKSRL